MSALSIKALELNQLLTEKLLCSRYVLEYDLKNNRFRSESRHKKLKWFYFCWMFVVLTLWPLATLYVLVYQGVFHPQTVTSNRLFFTLLLSATMVLCNGMNWNVFKNRLEIPPYLNLTLDLNRKYCRRPKPNQPNANQSTKQMILDEIQKLWDKKRWKEADPVGMLMILTTLYLAIITVFYIPIPFVMTVDPFSYLVHVFTHYEKLPLWIHAPLRVIPAIGANICCIETIRTIRTMFLILIYVAKITADLLKSIQKVSEVDISKAMELYKVVYAVHVKCMRPAGMILFTAIEGGMFIAIVSLTGTFVGWKILSPMLYWMAPMIAVVTLSIIAIALPFATNNADTSIDLINQWKFRIDECKQGSRKLNARTLKTFQPMAFYMSGFGYLLSDMKTRMFETIVLNTVDTVMMVGNLAG